MKYKFAIMSLFLAMQMANARNVTWANVGFVAVRTDDNIVYFDYSGGNLSGAQPSCASTATPNRFQIRTSNTLSSKGQLGILMLAKQLNKRISIYGTGSCNIAANGDEIASILVMEE